MKGFSVGDIQSNPIDRREKNRNRFLVRFFFTVIILINLLSGCTLVKSKVYRVGILSGMDGFLTIVDGFKEKMTGLGYIEGKNIEYNFWKLNNDPAEEEKAIKKYINDDVDLILAFPSRPAMKAKALTQGTDIPVVFAGASIEGNDLVKSQREPGDNITGVRYPTPEINGKRLEILLEIAPHVKRVMIICDINYPTYISAHQALDTIAAKTDITIIVKPVTTLDEIKSTLQELEKSGDIGIDALFLLPDLVTGSSEAWEIIEPFAIKHNLPLVGTMEKNYQGAGLFILNSSHHEIGSLAAVITDKILRGTPAGSIPVATPNLVLYINYRRAQELGLTIPAGLLKQAYQVIR